MNTIYYAMQQADKMNINSFPAWIIAILIIITEFKYIKKVVALALMKLYEFFIQRNVEKL